MANQKYIILAFLSAAVLVGMAVRGLSVPLLAQLQMGDPQVFGLVNATSVVGISCAVTTFLVLNRHPIVYEFTDEVIVELAKVTWPDKQETVRSTTVVVVFTLVVALALGVYDYVWARITNVFLFTEG
jgi:preprotein translocase subunit SecE